MASKIWLIQIRIRLFWFLLGLKEEAEAMSTLKRRMAD